MNKIKDLFKLLLAFTLALGCFVGKVDAKSNETAVPYASVINREINKEYEYALHLTNEPTEYVKIYIRGTYTHNINGTTEFLTNVNLVVDAKFDWSYPYGVEEGTVVGTYDVRVSNVSYSAVNKKLKVTFAIHLTSRTNYDVFYRTVTI